MKNLEHKEVPMDLEEMMIDYVLNRATQEEVEEFFGYAPHGFSRDCLLYTSPSPRDS